MPELLPGNTGNMNFSNISDSTDYFNQHIRYPEKRNPFQHSFPSFPGTFGGESVNSSKNSWVNHIDMFNYGTTPPTPSNYIYGQSEGTGRSIMVPLGHTP